jgi:hypothetical protein
MRIGILTYHKACNSGALIQAWALQKVLSGMGHEVSFPSCIETGVPIFKWRFARNHRFYIIDLIASCRNFLRTMVYNGYLRFRNRDLRRRYIRETACSANELSSKFDLLVVGSDQVWNPRCAVPSNYQLYIGHISGSAVSMVGYAVSGGDNLLDENTRKELQNAYDKFKAVSFREITLGEQLGVKMPIVALDPSLLLSKGMYEEIESKTLDGKMKGDYLFAYSATQNPKVLWKIKELGAKLGVRVVIAQIYAHWFWNRNIVYFRKF